VQAGARPPPSPAGWPGGAPELLAVHRERLPPLLRLPKRVATSGQRRRSIRRYRQTPRESRSTRARPSLKRRAVPADGHRGVAARARAANRCWPPWRSRCARGGASRCSSGPAHTGRRRHTQTPQGRRNSVHARRGWCARPTTRPDGRTAPSPQSTERG
jgi:hypothetical protein